MSLIDEIKDHLNTGDGDSDELLEQAAWKIITLETKVDDRQQRIAELEQQLAAAEATIKELESTVSNLVCLTTRLATHLRKLEPENDLLKEAIDYVKINSLFNVLRDNQEPLGAEFEQAWDEHQDELYE